MRKLYFILFLFIIVSCEDDQLLEDVILIKIEEDSIIADGSSSSKVTVTVDKDTDDAYKTLILKTSSGTFSESESDEITISDWLLVDGKLEATTTLVASCSATTAYVSTSAQNQILQDSIEFTISEPCKINVFASSIAVANNFSQEISISANLLNVSNGNASRGSRIEFCDIKKADGSISNGAFNLNNVSINCNAIATVNYSAGTDVNVGDEIIIYAFLKGEYNCSDLTQVTPIADCNATNNILGKTTILIKDFGE